MCKLKPSLVCETEYRSDVCCERGGRRHDAACCSALQRRRRGGRGRVPDQWHTMKCLNAISVKCDERVEAGISQHNARFGDMLCLSNHRFVK